MHKHTNEQANAKASSEKYLEDIMLYLENSFKSIFFLHL